MEAPEEYVEVSLARLDALRRGGPPQLQSLRATFQATTELMQASKLSQVFCAPVLRSPSFRQHGAVSVIRALTLLQYTEQAAALL